MYVFVQSVSHDSAPDDSAQRKGGRGEGSKKVELIEDNPKNLCALISFFPPLKAEYDLSDLNVLI